MVARTASGTSLRMARLRPIRGRALDDASRDHARRSGRGPRLRPEDRLWPLVRRSMRWSRPESWR